jgi:hypothetical protein
MTKAMQNGHRVYEYSVPLSVLGLELGDTIRVGVYTLDGDHPAVHRIANHKPDHMQPSFPWFDSTTWLEYTLTDDGETLTADGDLSDWTIAPWFSDDDAYDQTAGMQVVHNYDFYITVHDGELYVGIDYTDDTTDDVSPTGPESTDAAKVFFDTDYDYKYCCVDHTVDNFYFKEESEHNLKYYCVDALGNTGPVDEEKFKVEGTKFEIPLYKKWNLISVPFTLLDDDPEEVFKDTPGVGGVWTYDSTKTLCGYEWCVWTPEGPSNLDSILPGWGYWVLEMEEAEYNNLDNCVEGDVTCWDLIVPEWLVIGGSLIGTGPVSPPKKN